MLTSLTFWLVIAGGAVAFWMLPRWRDWVLFLGSAAYLSFFDWKSVLVLLALSSLAYGSTQSPKWRRPGIALTAGLAAGAYLAAYKYVPPLLDWTGHGISHAVTVPLGASYFTFKLIHYLVEASRGEFPEHKYSSFMAYMFFLPMFTAGPIERFDDFPQNRTPAFSANLLYRAGCRIADGLIKKLVIVDIFLDHQSKSHDLTNLARAIPLFEQSATLDHLLAHIQTVHPLFVWQFAINRFVSWYLDFSAYCDLAIGAGLLFGIKICENFDYPFLVTNVGDFWKRYHMSLSQWCQHYVYFPVLGWTRNVHLALYASMIAIGLWHAGNLNYLSWGLYQGTLLWFYLAWARYKRKRAAAAKKNKQPEPFAWLANRPVAIVAGLLTFLAICASAVFPTTQTKGMGAALRLFGALFGIRW